MSPAIQITREAHGPEQIDMKPWRRPPATTADRRDRSHIKRFCHIDKSSDIRDDIANSNAGFEPDDREDLLGRHRHLSDEYLEKRCNSYEEGRVHRKHMQAAASQDNRFEFSTNVVCPNKVKRAEFFAMRGMKDEMGIGDDRKK
jgi:hypothetical protein